MADQWRGGNRMKVGEVIYNRCEDYDNDPSVIYHAHDLPRCKSPGDAWFEGRWLCERHMGERIN